MKLLRLSIPTPPPGKLLAAALLAGFTGHLPTASAESVPEGRWVATWQASPQPVWSSDFLFPSNVPAELRAQTVRQVARISLGGSRLRLELSNAYGQTPIKVGAVSVAHASDHGEGAMQASTYNKVTFSGRLQATIAPGGSLLSDPVELPTRPRQRIVVNLHLPDATPLSTFHWDGRQTSWISSGDQASAATIESANGAVQSTTARILLSGIQVQALESARSVVVLGDSITDGATASLDADTRWTDFLAERLAAHDVAVVNAGISGARLLTDGMGVSALARLDRDVLTQPGVVAVILLIGINDISWPGTAFAPNEKRPTLQSLIAGYCQLIEQAHSLGLRVIGATLTPFEGALPGTPLEDYYSPEKDGLRRQVNEWIRGSGAFDAVIDFDAALRDQAHPSRMSARFDSGDHLHPSDEGNRAMAELVDLTTILSMPAATPAAKAHR